MPTHCLTHSLKMHQSYAHLSQFADLSPDGRKGSFIGVRRLANEELPAPGADPPPTNEAVAQAVQEKVAVSMLQLWNFNISICTTVHQQEYGGLIRHRPLLIVACQALAQH